MKENYVVIMTKWDNVKSHFADEFEFVAICCINMLGSFCIATFFTVMLWATKIILDFLGLKESLPLVLINNFTELEGVCFVGVFVIINIFKITATYRKQKKSLEKQETLESFEKPETEQ